MQSPINIPNGSGAQVRANINGAIESVASFYSGTIDPATMTPSSARPFMLWADTANSLIKQRNADNTSWGNVGTIVDGKFLFKVADTANTLVTPRNINGVAFDGSQDITINTSAEGAYPENFVASGRKITDVTGNQITIGAGKNVIDNVPIPFIGNSLTVPARSTSLIADKADGTTVLVPATYPTSYIDDNTVGFWVFNQTRAEANIPNSAVGVSSIAVANDLVPTGGITSVDGWADYAIKLDGTSGYYTSQNSTGIPIGASAREFSVMFTVNSIPTSAEGYIYSFSTSNRFDLNINRNTGILNVVFASTSYPTGYAVEVGKTYKVDVKYTSGILYVFINGVQIYQQTITLATTGAVLTVGRYTTGSYSNIILHYLEVRNATRTGELTGQIANKLCLPCSYARVDGTRANITEILPADSVSLGIVRGDTTGVTFYNDSEYQYGRREGAYGGNRKVFLGWKAISSGQKITFDNPLASSDIEVSIGYKKDLSSYRYTKLGFRYSGTNDSGVSIKSVSAMSIQVQASSSYVINALDSYTDTSETTGFIGVWVTYIGGC